jgi:hypothetical protein
VRRTPAQKKAYDDYKFTEQRADRYCGSVFVTDEGMARWEKAVFEKYEACKALGMGVEHGL